VLILAGYPKDKIDEYKNSGIDFFIYSGSDLLETLTQIQKKLGIGS
jgi:methylmalonyl-CoA mutase